MVEGYVQKHAVRIPRLYSAQTNYSLPPPAAAALSPSREADEAPPPPATQSRGWRSTSSVAASREPSGCSALALYRKATSGGDETRTRSTESGERPNLTPRS